MLLDWWRSDPTVQFKNIGLNNTPNIKLATEIFQNLAPVLLWLQDPNLGFWQSITKAVSNITSININPQVSFERFVRVVYDNLHLFHPRRVDDYIALIEKFHEVPISNFLFVSFSKLFSNINDFIYFISILRLSNHPIYRLLINEHGGIEKFVDFFVPFLNPQFATISDDCCKCRLLLAELIVDVVCDSPRELVNQTEIYLTIHQTLSRLIISAESSIAVPFIRILLVFYRSIVQKVSHNFISKRLSTLLCLVDPSTPGYGMIAHYAASLCPIYVSVDDLVPLLASQYFSSPFEFQLIYQKCNTVSADDILLGIKLFSRIMILSYYWGRLSGYYLSKLLIKGSKYEKVQEWFSNFLLKLKASTIIQEHKNKYVNRRMRLKEIFRSSLFSDLGVVSEIFDKSENDEIIPAISEIDQNMDDTSLKFLPFYSKGINLITTKKKKHRKKVKRSKSAPRDTPIDQNCNNDVKLDTTKLTKKTSRKRSKKKKQ